jgi:hypothetical protein
MLKVHPSRSRLVGFSATRDEALLWGWGAGRLKRLARLGTGASHWFSYSGDFGGTLRLIEKDQDRPRLLVPVPEGASESVVSRDGLYLTFGRSDGTVSVLNLTEIQRRLAEFRMGW